MYYQSFVQLNASPPGQTLCVQKISLPKFSLKKIFNFLVDNSTVTLNFTKIDDNKTNISLSHVKFIDEKTCSDHEGGWGNILDKLNDVMSQPVTTI